MLVSRAFQAREEDDETKESYRFIGCVSFPANVRVQGSLYGKPASVTGLGASSDLLLLPLENAANPHAALSLLENYSVAWRAVLSGDARVTQQLRQNPSGFLERLGGEGLGVHANSVEINSLLAFTDPDVVQASMSGDYAAFLRKLKTLNILSDNATSLMRQRVRQAFAALAAVAPNSRVSRLSEADPGGINGRGISNELRAIMRGMEYMERPEIREEAVVVCLYRHWGVYICRRCESIGGCH